VERCRPQFWRWHLRKLRKGFLKLLVLEFFESRYRSPRQGRRFGRPRRTALCGLALILPIRLEEPHFFGNKRSVDNALCHRHGLRFSHRLTCRRQTFIDVDRPLPNVMSKGLHYAEFNASMFHTSRRTNSTACSSENRDAAKQGEIGDSKAKHGS
jgi:hypothetical protein